MSDMVSEESNLRAAWGLQIINAVMTARLASLNRTLSDKALEMLDPAGVAIIRMVMPFHDRGRELDVDHHRIFALLKVHDEDEPMTAMFDILASDWDTFASVSDFEDELSHQIRQANQKRGT